MVRCKVCGKTVQNPKAECWKVRICPVCYDKSEDVENFDRSTLPYQFKLKSSPVDDYLDHGTIQEMKKLRD